MTVGTVADGSTSGRSALDERFTTGRLDTDVWLPAYLPHWSSRADGAAAYAVSRGELRLRIDPDHPLWCPDRHEEPLRVSCLQSGGFSGPVGSTRGQQPFRPGLTVREELPEFRGYTPTYGRIGVEMSAVLSPRSMFAFWLSGFEDVPERSGEICVAEIFGDTLDGETAAVGVGVHRFRDPTLTEDFGTVRLPLDVAELHRYEVEWSPGRVDFRVDDVVIRRCDQAPAYPVQLMLGLFDFPNRGSAGQPVPAAEMTVTRVWGEPPAS